MFFSQMAGKVLNITNTSPHLAPLRQNISSSTSTSATQEIRSSTTHLIALSDFSKGEKPSGLSVVK